MKLLSLVYVFLSVQLVTAQVDAVKSDVYNWDDLAIKQINGGERRNILQGYSRHFEFIEIDGFVLNPKASQSSSNNGRKNGCADVRPSRSGSETTAPATTPSNRTRMAPSGGDDPTNLHRERSHLWRPKSIG